MLRQYNGRHSLTEIDTLYPDVLEFLLLQDGLIPFFPHGFVLLMPPSKRFFWPVLIDRRSPSSPPPNS